MRTNHSTGYHDKKNHFRWSIESTKIGSGFYPTMQFLLGVQSFDDMIPQAPLQLYFSIFTPLLILLVLPRPHKFSSWMRECILQCNMGQLSTLPIRSSCPIVKLATCVFILHACKLAKMRVFTKHGCLWRWCWMQSQHVKWSVLGVLPPKNSLFCKYPAAICIIRQPLVHCTRDR